MSDSDSSDLDLGPDQKYYFDSDGGYNDDMATNDDDYYVEKADCNDDSEHDRDAAYTFMDAVGLSPTPDAVAQLTDVFVPCLRIMCERGYDPSGATWQEGGWRSQLIDIRKKFSRLWFHGWIKGVFRSDHGYDLINYVGYYQRLAMRGRPWGSWGEPESTTITAGTISTGEIVPMTREQFEEFTRRWKVRWSKSDSQEGKPR